MKIKMFSMGAVLEVVFYPFLLNPIRWFMLAFVFVLLLLFSWFDIDVEGSYPTRFLSIGVDIKGARKMWFDYFLMVGVTFVNTLWWDMNKSDAYVEYVLVRTFRKTAKYGYRTAMLVDRMYKQYLTMK